MVTTEDLARRAALELGPDISYARFSQVEDDDRRFLTGIEIAVLVGTGIVAAFWRGFLKGAEDRAEQLGESALTAIVERVRAFRFRRTREVQQAAELAQRELDGVVEGEIVAGLSHDEVARRAKESAEFQVREVAAYLEGAGFPPREADRHARRICARLREDLGG